ncbi:MerR family transcriptional regulator [Proteiniclasticum ruminis]|uniref:RDD family protein n=1 Tax=Proteiniclasticum ruminis TaxID=398199 RepID=A0A1G8LGS7_9CLOT|nr:MerR family transcriptional regulator [Proteiniclasticum ruminis]SDI54828.1 RDD family protein [Proteiniclasticum ruminis]
MQIKEVEEKTGLERSSIRFYEKEGLIHPRRLENGYREYGEENLEALYKIKLLRSLGATVEEVKEVFSGGTALGSFLTNRGSELQKAIDATSFAEELCQEIIQEDVSLEDLDGEKYLNRLNDKEKSTGRKYYEKIKLPAMDRKECVRRFTARMLDLYVYKLMVMTIRTLIFGQILRNDTILNHTADVVIALILMFFLEPVLLSRFGTTLGKYVMGIELRDESGEYMSYPVLKFRTKGIMVKGMAFFIPVLSWYFMYRSYQLVMQGESLPWEDHSEVYSFRKLRNLELNLFIGVILFYSVMSVFIQRVQTLPPNRGDLTLAEYVENYRYYAKYLNVSYEDYDFDDYGQWVRNKERDPFHLDLIYREIPMFKYYVRDNRLEEVSFEIHVKNKKLPIATYEIEMTLAYLAMVGAQKDVGILDLNPSSEIFGMGPLAQTSGEIQRDGVKVSSEISYEGYENRVGLRPLLPIDDSDIHEFSLRYRMIVP